MNLTRRFSALGDAELSTVTWLSIHDLRSRLSRAPNPPREAFDTTALRRLLSGDILPSLVHVELEDVLRSAVGWRQGGGEQSVAALCERRGIRLRCWEDLLRWDLLSFSGPATSSHLSLVDGLRNRT